MNPYSSVITGLNTSADLHYYSAETFPTIKPIYWLQSHFAVGGYSPLRQLSGMLTAHMTQIAPRNGFTWHPHRGLEIFTYVIDGELYHEDTTGGRGTITAGEVQRMFSGDYIAHQELNRTDAYARVIQIWFVAEPEYIGLPPHYQQVALRDMTPRQVGDGVVRDLIGPSGATDAHVDARLTSTIVPAGGSAPIELPQAGEELLLYVVDGAGRVDSAEFSHQTNIYDVLLATPDSSPVTLTADTQQLNFLSFYLKPFMQTATTA